MKDWITIGKRLPFHTGKVAAVIESGEDTQRRKIVKASFNGTDWSLRKKHEGRWYVTHWAELPLLPPRPMKQK